MTAGLDQNPLLDVKHPIAFDRISADHVVPAITALLADAEARLARLERDPEAPGYDNTLGALERVTDAVGRAMGVVSHLESVATTPDLRRAYSTVQPLVSAFYSKIPLSSALYARLRAYAGTVEAQALDPTRARFLKKTLESFVREGAALDPDKKARLQALNVELAELTTRFSQNVLDDTNAFELCIEDRERLRGLPERVIEAARENASARGVGGFRFTLHEPSLVPLLTYLDDASLRERVFRSYYSRAASGPHDNREVVRRILALRREKALLLGYRDFVDLVVDERMAHTAARARAFLEDLRSRSQTAFTREQAELQEFRRTLAGEDAPLASWDIAYYSEKQRTARYDFDEEALRPYFPLEAVFGGLFEIAHRLYGVRIEGGLDVPVWHESVRAFRVRDGDGSELGVFYADLFPREQKRGGAWMDAFLTAERSAQGWTPHAGLICANVTPPVGGAPALLSHREVQTMFHEFGHLMHHMLSRVEVRSLSGTNVAWDFVELPSQIMENFCWEREALDLFAKHHQTGERIPEELFSRMQRARTYRGASGMMRQLGFGLVDLKLHMDYDSARDGDVLEYSRALFAQFSPAPLPDDHALIMSFGHVFSHPIGYAGGYYSYKWAEVLDADAFSRFRDEGLFSCQVGREFRDKVLARGDSRDPLELFVDFMGREPDLDPLLARAGVN